MLIVAIGEELVFRGYLLNNLMESLNKYIALVISAAVFALVHGTNPDITDLATLNLFLGGCLLGINYIYTRNLWFAILFHFTWNFFQGPVYGFKVSGLHLPGILQQELHGNPIFTGGAFGFEGSVVATVLCCSCLFLLFLAYEKKYTTITT
jgi:membrane protease YdiL (CAAX protease family)